MRPLLTPEKVLSYPKVETGSTKMKKKMLATVL